VRIKARGMTEAALGVKSGPRGMTSSLWGMIFKPRGVTLCGYALIFQEIAKAPPNFTKL